ncbi:MAG: methylcrotonoyl-CoA carboxylase [Planktomarina sp.]|nr:methylcrotonoyl-CoA carboxylase [Planktomarina sp.]MDT2077903.1 carboxyl transferase domain-containing protein [Planktomarina sp.]HAJ84126.1 methylcrotonoyl-CoA carboxylase [Paracoccaceae bacterium]
MSRIVSKIDPRSLMFKKNQTHAQGILKILRARIANTTAGGPERLRNRHHERGKHLVRDRIERMIDPGTAFLELSPLAAWGQYDNEVPAAGICTGIGIVEGKPVTFIANDATVKGGSFFHETVKKHLRAQEIAADNRLPCIYLVDCGGAYLPEQDRVFPDRDHFGNTFHRQCRMSASGLPQISIVFGGCTAGGAYIPALSDQVIMVESTARIHLGGPSIVKIAINEEVDGETLGGAAMHTRVSGVSDHLAQDEDQALALARKLLGHANLERRGIKPAKVLPPYLDPGEIDGIVSADTKMPYDVREIIGRMVDDSVFSEFKPEWGETLVCGTAHIHGLPIGVLGNNGALFSESSLKGAHFISMCDQRNIPLLFLHNVPGFMVGTEAERGGIAKNSAKMVYAQAVARVPKLSVIVGGSYGAGNYGMCGRGFWPNFMFAWPSSVLATMSADIASNVMLELRRNNIKAAPPTQDELDKIDAQVRAQYGDQSDPYYATSRMWDDGIIEPTQTRDVLGLCLWLIATTPEKTNYHAPVFRM